MCCYSKWKLSLVFITLFSFLAASSSHLDISLAVAHDNEVSANSAASDVDTRTGWPTRPFRGIINFYHPHMKYHSNVYDRSTIETDSFGNYIDPPWESDPEINDGPSLQFWNYTDSTLSSVPLKLMTTGGCGPGHMVASLSGIEMSYFNHHSGRAYIRVPWNDEAYPLLAPSLESWISVPGSWTSASLASTVRVSPTFVIEQPIFYVNVFRITNAADTRFFEFDRNNIPTDLGTDISKMDYPLNASEREIFSYLSEVYYNIELAGTDGQNYGLLTDPHEPNCGPQLANVISAHTGKSLICGWGNFGPILVNFDSNFTGISETVFPLIPSSSAVAENEVNFDDNKQLSEALALPMNPPPKEPGPCPRAVDLRELLPQ